MKLSNDKLIEHVVTITASRLSNTTLPINGKAGEEEVADFMQSIYDKLVELNQNYKYKLSS